MSDNIPADLQSEIMAHLPLKSLIQFRSVSKTWKSIIDSKAFISKHYNNGHHTQTQVQHLLVMYQDKHSRFTGLVVDKYVSIVDDHTFPKQIVSLTPPPLVKKLQCPRLIGTSRWLVCLHSMHYRGSTSTTDVVVIWNISIRKAVAVFLPNVAQGLCGRRTTLAFGVCRVTNDPKIVKIKQFATCNPVEVEVFALSTGAWRRSYGNLPPRILTSCILDSHVVIDGVIYWLAIDKNTTDDTFLSVIISFNMSSEEFGEITLPHGFDVLNLSKLGESLLVVVVHNDEALNFDFDVWMMGDGVPKSFTKLFTFTLARVYELGFRKDGKLIVESQEQGDDDDRGQLAVYEPHSKHVDNIGIEGSTDSFVVCDYMETLLLLDQKDLMVYK